MKLATLSILSLLSLLIITATQAQLRVGKPAPGIIYAVKNTGELFWYKDLYQNGTNGKCGERGWDSNSGNQIANGFEDMRQLISAGNGMIYGLKNTGELFWYSDTYQNGRNGPDGSGGWNTRGSGEQIGCGWDFKQIVYGGDGIIYALKNTGELLWYKDLYQNGTNGKCGEYGWHANSGNQIGCGWDFKHIVYGGNGIIYALKNTGELLWYKDTNRNGTNGKCGEQGWDANSGKQIGCGWGDFKQFFSGGNGIIYAVNNTGELRWYKDLIKNGSNGKCGERGWDSNSGKQIGCGWKDFK